MGRTLPPFSQLIEQERRAWVPFKRALRKADQVAFDRLLGGAKRHVQAGVYLSRPWPFQVNAMAMLLEHQKLLERLLDTVEGSVRARQPPLHCSPASREGRGSCITAGFLRFEATFRSLLYVRGQPREAVVARSRSSPRVALERAMPWEGFL